MTIPNYMGEHFPQGRKLTTYEPGVPGNYETGAGGDNVLGFIVSRGGSKNRILASDEFGPIYPRLIVIVAAQDSQEQSSHRSLVSMADLLLRPKTPAQAELSAKLLNQFDFLFFPFVSQANVRDGRSRYGFDAPRPGDLGDGVSAEHHNNDWLGLSSVGKVALQKAIEDWVSDHPYPQRSVFCLLTLHCDVLNMTVNTGANPISKGIWALRNQAGYQQTAPYAKLHYPDGPIMRFRQPEGRDGFDAVIWREAFTPNFDTIIEGDYGWGLPPVTQYGGTQMYFEAPWNATTHKASHDVTQEDADNFAEAYLTGVAVVSAVEDYYGPVTVAATSAVTAQGVREQLGQAQVQAFPSFTAQGHKDARDGVLLQTSAALSVSGRKEGRGATHVGGGALTASGLKEISGPVGIAASTAVTVKGTALEVREGAVSISATPGLSVTGRKVGRGEAHVAGLSTALTVRGQKRGTGAVAIGAQTSVTVIGSRQDIVSGAVRISAQSAVSARGFKTAAGAVSVRSNARVQVNNVTPVAGVITPIPLDLDLSPIALVMHADREALTLELGERLTLTLEAM